MAQIIEIPLSVCALCLCPTFDKLFSVPYPYSVKGLDSTVQKGHRINVKQANGDYLFCGVKVGRGAR